MVRSYRHYLQQGIISHSFFETVETIWCTHCWFVALLCVCDTPDLGICMPRLAQQHNQWTVRHSWEYAKTCIACYLWQSIYWCFLLFVLHWVVIIAIRWSKGTDNLQFFSKMLNQNSCLSHLIPERRDKIVLSRLRNAQSYPVPFARTQKLKKSFIVYALSKFQILL